MHICDVCVNVYIYVCISIVADEMSSFNSPSSESLSPVLIIFVNIYQYMYTCMYMHIYIYIYTCICVYM